MDRAAYIKNQIDKLIKIRKILNLVFTGLFVAAAVTFLVLGWWGELLITALVWFVLFFLFYFCLGILIRCIVALNQSDEEFGQKKE